MPVGLGSYFSFSTASAFRVDSLFADWSARDFTELDGLNRALSQSRADPLSSLSILNERSFDFGFLRDAPRVTPGLAPDIGSDPADDDSPPALGGGDSPTDEPDDTLVDPALGGGSELPADDEEPALSNDDTPSNDDATLDDVLSPDNSPDDEIDLTGVPPAFSAEWLDPEVREFWRDHFGLGPSDDLFGFIFGH